MITYGQTVQLQRGWEPNTTDVILTNYRGGEREQTFSVIKAPFKKVENSINNPARIE